MAVKDADIAIIGGTVVNARGARRADVLVKGERIAGVEAPGGAVRAKRTIDASGKLVFPGIIDAHLHHVYSDRVETLSKAAIYGGITCLIPYAGAVKAWGVEGTLLDAVKATIEEIEERSMIDVGMHCCIMQADLEGFAKAAPAVIDLGAISFKAFMAYKKRGMMLEDPELLRIMEVLVGTGGLFAVHAENGAAIDYLENKFISEGKLGPEHYESSHPSIIEAEATFRILSLAAIVNCPMYIPHISAWQAMDVVRLFREWGSLDTLHAETCIHYLTLTDEMMASMGSLAKVGPPLRHGRDIERLWKAVADGEIDVIASDVAGQTKARKEPVWDNIHKAPAGLPGQESFFTVTYDEAINKGRIPLPRLIEAVTEKPARIFGLYPRKGVLQEGSDADVVVFDPTLPHTIRAADEHTNADYSMFEGRECLGKPVMVMQRGKVLLEDGEIKAVKGQGRYLPGKLN